MYLQALEVGQRFSVTALPHLTGRLVRLGTASAMVEWGQGEVVTLPTGDTFIRPRRSSISLHTEVTPQPEEAV